MKNTLILTTFIVLTLITACSIIHKQHSINITLPNFILVPTFQAEPIVFFNGKWYNLPNSQSNYWSNSTKELVVCGSGGLYIYSSKNNSIDYLYKTEWFPCHGFVNVDNDIFMTDGYSDWKVSNSEITITFSLSQKKVISLVNGSGNLNYISPRAGELKYLFPYKSEICDINDTVCAMLSENHTVTFLDRADSLNNILYLVGIKDNKLFYATDNSYGSVINHRLNVYDLDSKQNYALLDDFRADYQFMIFFD